LAEKNVFARDGQVSGSAILAGSGRVTGQCVRPGVWPGFEFEHARLLWRRFYRV